MAAVTGPDMQLKKAFQELQIKKANTTKQMHIMDDQKQKLSRKIRQNELVCQELQTLPSETKLYNGVGKMFVNMSSEEINELLNKEKQLCHDNIAKIEKNKEVCDNNLKESENSLRELISSKQKGK